MSVEYVECLARPHLPDHGEVEHLVGFVAHQLPAGQALRRISLILDGDSAWVAFAIQEGNLYVGGGAGRSGKGHQKSYPHNSRQRWRGQDAPPSSDHGPQGLPKWPAMLVISVPSTNPSGGSAMSPRAGTVGTAFPNHPASIVMSV